MWYIQSVLWMVMAVFLVLFGYATKDLGYMGCGVVCMVPAFMAAMMGERGL